MSQSCDQYWADVQVSGSTAGGTDGDHYIADCIFVGAPGTWTVDGLSAIDDDLNPLSCCTAEYTSSAVVTEGQTTEISGLIQCDTEGNGALDIYVTINTPPQIDDVDISPSKFGETCSVITLNVTATDPEGDDISYGWFVVSAPAGAVYSIDDMGDEAYFATETMGDYTVRVTATDPLGASHSLDFPLHIVEDNIPSCDVNELTADMCEP